MAKQLKLKIKNIQLAQAAGLEKEKKPKASEKVEDKAKDKPPAEELATPRRKAKTKSSFAPPIEEQKEDFVDVQEEASGDLLVEEVVPTAEKEASVESSAVVEEHLIELVHEETIEPHIVPPVVPVYQDIPLSQPPLPQAPSQAATSSQDRVQDKSQDKPYDKFHDKFLDKSQDKLQDKFQDQSQTQNQAQTQQLPSQTPQARPAPRTWQSPRTTPTTPPPPREKSSFERLGPTGRHVKDLYTSPKRPPAQQTPRYDRDRSSPPDRSTDRPTTDRGARTFDRSGDRPRHSKPPYAQTPHQPQPPVANVPPSPTSGEDDKFGKKKVRDFKDVKQPRKEVRPFDARDRQGLTEGEDERWRKRRPVKGAVKKSEEPVIRPTKLSVKVPISIKDLASEMKLKASELIQKLFMQGLVYTLNDVLDDETTLLLLGSEFGCEITIDTKEEERIQITKKTIQEEIEASDPSQLVIRPPVAVFMGHVDHGKTSLIDAIRKSNITKSEAGAITQHIGAFRCKTAVGDITILDTPGHAAFSAMRARGAEVTDIVVLVVAGDEGIREQTLEAMQHAKAANVTIVVAVNKCDKPNFSTDTVYRQLADADLLPEAWGGAIITVNTSAVTGQGIPQLLEMLALQAEVLELKANPHTRARGTVLESEMHKGFGATATVLVQNGTLRQGDAIVLENHWGRVKTMRDEFGHFFKEAGPATPVEITGLSGVPEAGDSFIVVRNEKEARDIAETRAMGTKAKAMVQKKPTSLESMLKDDATKGKKVLKLIIRSDVQGSVEALKATLEKIESSKVDLEIIFAGVGEVTESDVQLASASNAVILGFHTQIESRASGLIKELGVIVKLHNIIYHAVDDVKAIMQGLLDKIAEEKDTGRAEVRAVFKASQLGVIAGCQVIEGTIMRPHYIRVERGGKVVWKGTISSLKRVKEDVREVKKGMECGILLNGYNDVQVGDFLQAYEIIYLTQEI